MVYVFLSRFSNSLSLYYYYYYFFLKSEILCDTGFWSSIRFYWNAFISTYLEKNPKILFRVSLLIVFAFFFSRLVFSFFGTFLLLLFLSLTPMELTDFLQNKFLTYQMFVNLKQVCINIIYTTVKYGDSGGERKMQEKKFSPPPQSPHRNTNPGFFLCLSSYTKKRF